MADGPIDPKDPPPPPKPCPVCGRVNCTEHENDSGGIGPNTIRRGSL